MTDTITVATQAAINNQLQQTVEALIDDQPYSQKPKARIQLEAHEVQYQTEITSKMDIIVHKKYTLHSSWKNQLLLLHIPLVIAEIVLLILIIRLSSSPQDSSLLRIQDFYFWQLSVIEALSILCLILQIILIIAPSKQLHQLVALSQKALCSLITLSLIITIVSRELSNQQSNSSLNLCISSKIQSLNSIYQLILQDQQQNCCPTYPYSLSYPFWKEYFNCNTNGTDTSCLGRLKQYQQSYNITQLMDLVQLENDYNCIGVCQKGPVPINFNVSQLYPNYPYRNLIQLSINYTDPLRSTQPCIESAVQYFKDGINPIWKYSLSLLLIYLLNLMLHLIFYFRMKKLDTKSQKVHHDHNRK